MLQTGKKKKSYQTKKIFIFFLQIISDKDWKMDCSKCINNIKMRLKCSIVVGYNLRDLKNSSAYIVNSEDLISWYIRNGKWVGIIQNSTPTCRFRDQLGKQINTLSGTYRHREVFYKIVLYILANIDFI